MIVDPESGIAISSLGWDGPCFWVIYPDGRKIRFEEGLGIKPAKGGYFQTSVRIDDRIEHGLRSFNAPETQLSSLTIPDSGYPELGGEVGLWRYAEPAILHWSESAGHRVLLVKPDGSIRTFDTPWFNNEHYDLGYQSLVQALSLSDGRIAISIQRSSTLVLINPISGLLCGEIKLADRHGNPDLELLDERTLLAVDYDTLVRVALPSGAVLQTVRLQDASDGMTQQFIGSARLTADRRQVVVPRPFSGDVLLLDADDFSTLATARTGGRPFEAVKLANGDVVVREWPTGALSAGRFS